MAKTDDVGQLSVHLSGHPPALAAAGDFARGSLVIAQCKFRVQKFFSLVQIAFDVANAVNAAAVSCGST